VRASLTISVKDMCRILTGWLKTGDFESLRIILDSFIKGSEHDGYLEKASGGRYSSHDDGWGIAAVGLAGGKPSVVYHKMLNPIFDADSIKMINLIEARLKRYDEVAFIVHSRKSSRFEPYGGDYLHPFIRLFENGAGWFAHNGGVDKVRIAGMLGVHPWTRVDSELLAYYLMNSVEECLLEEKDVDRCVIKSYESSLDYVPPCSGLNTGLLLLLGDKPYLYTTHFIGRPCKNQSLIDYFRMLLLQVGESWVAASITLADYLPQHAMIAKTIIVDPGLYKLSSEGWTRLVKY